MYYEFDLVCLLDIGLLQITFVYSSLFCTPSASADNSYLDLDDSGYHKNQIYYCFIVHSTKK